MNSHDVAALAVMPIAMWALLLFAQRPSNRLALLFREVWDPRSEHDSNRGAQQWALTTLTVHLIVTAMTVWVLLSSRLHITAIIGRMSDPFWQVVQGMLVGFALAGLFILLLQWLPEVHRFRLALLVRSGPSISTSFGMLCLFTGIHEFWRVVCLRSIMMGGSPADFALKATALAYGLSFVFFGMSAGIAEGILGAVYAALFLWQGNVIPPLVAHLTLQAQLFVFSLSTPPTDRAWSLADVLHTKCPACGAAIVMKRVVSGGSFRCARCNTKLSPSDGRIAFMRWGFIFIFFLIYAMTWRAFHTTPSAEGNLMVRGFIVALFAARGLLLFSYFLFPPELQCGEPGFIAMNLNRTDFTEGPPAPEDKPKLDNKLES